MSFADIQARVQSKAGGTRTKSLRAAEQARKIADYKAAGYVWPISEWLGHNNGPSLDLAAIFVAYCWRKAHAEAWKPPTQEIGIRRARKAAALGVSYHTYVLEILERGRYLDEQTAAELRAR